MLILTMLRDVASSFRYADFARDELFHD